MRLLRVVLDAPPDPMRANAWALFDSNGRLLQQGRSVPSQWPPAERREAVLASDTVRLVALDLPPLPRDRLLAAATYALEDRLATPIDDVVVAVGERGPAGRVHAVVAPRELAAALVDASPPFARAIAEPQLAQPVDGWRWCESDIGGFVRTNDGAAFAVSRALGDALPSELALALDQAARDGRAPARVVVDRTIDAEALARWEEATGVRFVAGAPWRWQSAPPVSFAAATDVLASLRRALATRRVSPARPYAVALTIAVLAAALHLVAAAGTWAWQRVALARAEQGLVSVAHEAGARNAAADNAAAATAALYADARHRAGLAAPTDAMPVLARAAPALVALPPGTLRSANWTANAWTLELAPVDEPTLSAFAQRMGHAGLSLLHARTASGIRARIAFSP